MTDSDCCVTPTSPDAQKATNNATPSSTEGHKNPEWTPLAGKCYGQGGSVQ